MSTNKLLVAVVLAIAIGAPIGGFSQEHMEMPQPTHDNRDRGTIPPWLSDRRSQSRSPSLLPSSARTNG